MTTNSPATEKPWTPRNWGTVAGMLMASLVTVVGVATGLEPETILLRCAVSSAIVMIAVTWTARVCQSPRGAVDDDG